MPTPDASQYIQMKRIQANATASVAESPLKFRASLGLSGYGFIPGLKARFGPNALISNKFLQPKPSGPSTTIVNVSYETSNVVASCGGSVCTFTLVAIFPDIVLTDAFVQTMGLEPMTVVSSNRAEFVITNYTLPVGDPFGPGPVSFVVNGGKYVATSSIIIDAGPGSSSQVAQLYSASPTPPFTSGGSIYFVGELDGYVCAGANTDFVIPAESDFTVMWWQYLDTTGSSNRFPRPFSMGNGTIGDIFTVSMEGSGATKTIYVWINGSSRITVPSVNVGNDWHHFAVIRSSSTITLYKNGVPIGSKNTPGGSPFDSNTEIGSATASLILGQKYTRDDQQETFVGWISKFVFDSGAARYTSDFSATLPLNDGDNSGETTKLFLPCSDRIHIGVDNSGQGNNVGFYGNTTAHTPGFAPRSTPLPGDMTANTPYTFTCNTSGEYGAYTTAFVLDFTAPSTTTYTITYSGIGGGTVCHVISTTTPGTVITDRGTQTPITFSSGNTVELNTGDHLYMMPIGSSGDIISIQISG